jgi:hypothetical protein
MPLSSSGGSSGPVIGIVSFGTSSIGLVRYQKTSGVGRPCSRFMISCRVADRITKRKYSYSTQKLEALSTNGS